MFLPYLMLGYAAAALLLLGGLQMASRAVPGLLGIRILRWAMISALLGVLLMALRSHAPDWITILCANAAIYACILLVYWATAETLSVPPTFLPWGIGMGAAVLCGLACFTYLDNNLLARILISSSGMAVYAGFTAALLFRFKDPAAEWLHIDSSLRSHTSVLAWLQIANGLDHVIRCILSLRYPPASYVHMDIIQAGFTYMNMLLNVAACCGVIWIALSIQRHSLQQAALTDSLTGLLNRRAFEESFARTLRRGNHDRQPLAVLLLDIDRFKAINDTWGHQVGDEVIRCVGRTLKNHMRPADTLCRIGGEEFVMMMHNTSLDEAGAIAWRLRAEMDGLIDLPSGVHLTVSLGVAGSRVHETPEELLRRCDEALYCSKRAGRNRVTVDATPGASFLAFSGDHPSLPSEGPLTSLSTNPLQHRFAQYSRKITN